MIIQGMFGLGDNVYQRAFVKNLRKPIFLETCWPQIYQDIQGIEFVRPDVRLRTQRKNVNIVHPSVWSKKSRSMMGGNSKRIFYGAQGIFAGMQQCFGVLPATMDLPTYGESLVAGKYAVVRPVTIRSEWQNEARAPLPEYVAECMDILRSNGFKIVSVADLQDGHEWMVGEYQKADIEFHYGELNFEQLMALCQNASVIVGGTGWILPVGIAYDVPTWLIAGGQGGFNHPKLISPPHQNHRAVFAMPETFCMCREKSHNCNKVIKNHAQKFTDWLQR